MEEIISSVNPAVRKIPLGTIALHRGRTIGESVFDPVFVMAAILEWAGIAKNGRGELILTEEHNDL